ncbi:MAG: DUF5615 family PIN-like protein [Trueperaceae bacterium]
MRFLTDETFNNHILRALFQRDATLDIVRVQDVGLTAVDAPEILEWAAKENRILLTDDVETMTHFAYERVRESKEMLGVIEVEQAAALAAIVEDILHTCNLWFGNRYNGTSSLLAF